MPNNVWSELLARIETKVNRHSFNTWFSPTVFVEDTGDRVTVRVPSELCRNWLTKHYTAVITEATAEVQRSGVKIAFVIDVDAGNVEPQSPSASRAPAPGAAARGLNPRYTFDSFVVGSSNQFAHAASLAVGEAPSRSYNPLYLYGGVGLGKTHLMHAIGHYLLGQMPDLSLTYISSERFMNEMINAVRYDRILDFRERYRKLDVLMVDDVQFLSGKEGTQTEFFHTFNSLYDAQKQIVISSDCPPHEIQQLEERLRSRFEWGLIADIQSPDLETKVAILKKKAEAETVPLPDDVALYIASGIKSNVRELEGSLIRLIAYASLDRKRDLADPCPGCPPQHPPPRRAAGDHRHGPEVHRQLLPAQARRPEGPQQLQGGGAPTADCDVPLQDPDGRLASRRSARASAATIRLSSTRFARSRDGARPTASSTTWSTASSRRSASSPRRFPGHRSSGRTRLGGNRSRRRRLVEPASRGRGSGFRPQRNRGRPVAACGDRFHPPIPARAA